MPSPGPPKITLRFINMNMNNACRVYREQVSRYTPERRSLTMPNCVKELSHSLMQAGDAMRTQKAKHLRSVRDLTNVFDYSTGRNLRNDAMGLVAEKVQSSKAVTSRRNLARVQKYTKWRVHQSVAYKFRGRCGWRHCPGLRNTDAVRPRSYLTYMRCEECSARNSKDVFFCNDIKKGKPCTCHVAYHNKYHNK